MLGRTSAIVEFFPLLSDNVLICCHLWNISEGLQILDWIFFPFHFFKDVVTWICHLYYFQHKIWCHLICILLCSVLFLWSLLWFFFFITSFEQFMMCLSKFLVLGVSLALVSSGLMFYLDLEYFQSLFFQILFSASPLSQRAQISCISECLNCLYSSFMLCSFFLTFFFFSFFACFYCCVFRLTQSFLLQCLFYH